MGFNWNIKFQMCPGIQLLPGPAAVLLHHVPSAAPQVMPQSGMGRAEAHTGSKRPGHPGFIQQHKNIDHLVLSAFPTGSHCSAWLWPRLSTELTFSHSPLNGNGSFRAFVYVHISLFLPLKGYPDPLLCLTTL